MSPKNFGPSLANHYPIKKKWQIRELRPNWDGIQWLESYANDFECDTDIQYEATMGGADLEVNVTFAYGRERQTFPRPMFEVIPRDAFSCSMQPVTPCEACDDFSKSWSCEAHPQEEWGFGDRLQPWVDALPPTEPRGIQLDVSGVLLDQQAGIWRARLDALTRGTITGSFELEVSGETLQGIQSFSIEVEPNDQTST